MVAILGRMENIMSADSRLTDRLISYWHTIRKENAMPDFSQFNASAIDDIWQQCVLFTVAPAIENKSATLNFYQIGEKFATSTIAA